MQIKLMYGAFLFIVGWFWFYLFFRQFLFNFVTAYPLIRKMRSLREDLIAIGASRYTGVSVAVSFLICAAAVGIVAWLCPLYLKISFAIGAVLGLVMYVGKLSPSNRSMFDAFCVAYYRFVPDDELRTAMYNKKIGQMKSRLHAMGIKGSFIPEFKD